jgi:amidase
MTLERLISSQVLPHPPILRGIEKVRAALENGRHTVSTWTPYKHDLGVDLINKVYAADASTVRDFFRG